MHSEELEFKSGFGSFEARLDEAQLSAALETESLQFEVFHSDRVRADVKIGSVVVPLSRLRDCEFKKTKHSYVRIYDAFHTIDEWREGDGEARPNAIGQLRFKVFLEDLGPAALLTAPEPLPKQIGANLQLEEELRALEERAASEGLGQLQNNLGGLTRRARNESGVGVGELAKG